MKLECNIRIEDQVYPDVFPKRFVKCNLYIGALKSSGSPKPRLYLQTSSSTYEYQIINNILCVRGTNEKDVTIGKATIVFSSPKHYVMINCEREKLANFLKVLRKLSNNTKIQTSDVAVLTDLKKPTNKLKLATPVDQPFTLQLRRQHPSLWGALTNNLKTLDLKNVKFKLPVILGRIPLLHVCLTYMELHNDDLLWLNEFQIRKSLEKLNLSNNKLTEFPMAVIDCPSLDCLILSCNSIQYLPHGIGRLRKLRILQISHNRLHFLPADISFLKLENLDLAFNRLYSNVPVNISQVDCNSRGRFRLEDWAALNVDPGFRFRLTANDCPNVLLKKLRSLSRCICDKITPRLHSTEYFVPLHGVRFSAMSCIEPQSKSNEESSRIVYLQYHFCKFQSHCVDKNFRRISAVRLIRLES